MNTIPADCPTRIRGQTYNHWGPGPGKSGVFRARRDKKLLEPSRIFDADPWPATDFRKFYERSDLPIAIKHGTKTTT